MIHVIKKMLFCLLVLSIASCDKGGQEESEGKTVNFSIVPTIVETGAEDITQAETRTKVSTFSIGSMIGLRLAAPSAFPAISPVYNHFYGLYNGATWFYYLGNINTGDRLSGFSNWGTIRVNGYYPYNNTVSGLEAIPFRIATMNGDVAEGTGNTVATDHLIAATQTRDMETDDFSEELPLQFGHLMTAIEFEVNRSVSSVPALTLTTVTYEISGGSPAREFAVSGTYDATHPDMANLGNSVNAIERAKKMVISYPLAPALISGSVYTILLVMMPELRQTIVDDDATVKMTFQFKDQDGTPYLFEDIPGGIPSLTFKLSEITNDNNNNNGLLAGWSYKVKATLGYYTKFTAPTTGTPMPPHVNYNELVDDPNNEFVDI